MRSRRSRTATLTTASWLVLTLTACAPRPVVYTDLDRGLGPLRDAFNAESSRTRVVMLVAPTCDVCLRGAAAVHGALLAREPDPRLRPLVIWVPKVRGKATNIAAAAELVPDARVQHFWDGSGLLMNAYQRVLTIREDAWDVFLLYEPGVRWDGELPPKPRFWMHQLGTQARPRVQGPYLDSETFAHEALAVLRRSPAAGVTPAPASQ